MIVRIAAVLIILFALLAAFVIGHQMALRNLSFKNVSATQAAEAMKNDDFYDNYKENVVIIRGQITSIYKNANTIKIGLKTTSTYGLQCTLNTNFFKGKIGDVITIEGIGGNAVREPAGVLLQNCKLA